MHQPIHGAAQDFFARVAAAQPGLTPKMAQLAAYVSTNHVACAFMSSRELAAIAGVSLATVVRFATQIGYANYDAFRSALQDRVNVDLTSVERWQTLPSASRSPSALLRRIIDADLQSLRALAHDFSEPQAERFVGALAAADRVAVIGFRWVAPLTNYFVYSLNKIKPRVQAFTAADSSLYDMVQLMERGDIMVALAFARYSADLVKLANFAREREVRILAITDSPLSPLVPLAEVTLYARLNVLDFVGSLAAPAALINCVVSELGIRLGDEALLRLRAFEESATATGTYAPSWGYPEPTIMGMPGGNDVGDPPLRERTSG